MKRPYKICSRCVMDTSDEDIYFDHSGFCNHCINHLSLSSRFRHAERSSQSMLTEMIRRIKNDSKHNAYDCLVGVSGGVDSSYVAMLCKDYGLRALLVHFDNGWNTPAAVKNIGAIVDALGFDYVTEVADWEVFRDIQLSILSSGSVDLEYPTDLGIFAVMMESARINGIKYILSGNNLATEGMLPLTWGYHRYRDVRYYRSIVGPSKCGLIKSLPHYTLARETIVRLLYRIKTVSILNFIPYSKERAKLELINRFGWTDYGGKHNESWITAFWQGYVMNKRFGFDYRRPTLSAEICMGLTERRDALRVLEQAAFTDRKYADSMHYIAKKFGLPYDELLNIIDKPPKSYKDFENSKAMIDFVHLCYRRVFQ